MTQQTENYLILKPIAERFKRVSEEITDNDIKYIIRDLLKEKIAESIDFSYIQEKLSEWIDTHEDEIIHAMQESIQRRLDLPSNYRWY